MCWNCHECSHENVGNKGVCDKCRNPRARSRLDFNPQELSDVVAIHRNPVLRACLGTVWRIDFVVVNT